MEFEDRASKYPNRVLITPESGAAPFYATVQRADEPIREGTPLNAVVFNEMIAMIQSVALDATVE